jgi:hypothetical protein
MPNSEINIVEQLSMLAKDGVINGEPYTHGIGHPITHDYSIEQGCIEGGDSVRQEHVKSEDSIKHVSVEGAVDDQQQSAMRKAEEG